MNISTIPFIVLVSYIMGELFKVIVVEVVEAVAIHTEVVVVEATVDVVVDFSLKGEQQWQKIRIQ